MRAGGAMATATCARAQPFVQNFAPLRREPFRVVEAAWNIVGIENDRRSDDRTGQRAASGFVASRDRPDTALERGALTTERRPRHFLVERQARRLHGATYPARLTMAA